MDAPETGDSLARTCHHIRNRGGEDRDERDKDAETGVDDACLDADTSGDETENMSISGDPHPDNASTTAGSTMDRAIAGNNRFHQDSSMGVTMMNNQSSPKISPFHGERDRSFSIFDSARLPPIPAKKTPSKALPVL